MTQLQVNQFSHGLLNEGLGWLLSCLGSFIGLRCLTRARAYTGRTRAIWLLIASVAVGGTGIWAMHFVAMLGYTIPGQEILYNCFRPCQDWPAALQFYEAAQCGRDKRFGVLTVVTNRVGA